MKKKDGSLSQYYQMNAKYLVIFLWLSLTLHLYALWGVSSGTVYFREQLAKKYPKTQTIHNIILETRTESPLDPKEAAVSDKNNISSAPTHNPDQLEEYNVVNFNQAKAQGQGGTAAYIPQKANEVQEPQKKIVKVQEEGVSVQKKVLQARQRSSEGGGETAPTLYDVKKKPIVNLYNTGISSIATKSKDYANYFIKMQKKIEKYHREFFPIYQYYQGLLKDGEVVVQYELNQKGDIVDAQIVSSYGSDIVDNASLNSIVYAKNFGSLPKDFQDEEGVVVRFHFVYISR